MVERFPSLETGPLVNVLVCGGEQGRVLEVKAKCRTGPENFVTLMRKALGAKYGDQPVALGGVFLIAKGKAKLHVMVCTNFTTVVYLLLLFIVVIVVIVVVA